MKTIYGYTKFQSILLVAIMSLVFCVTAKGGTPDADTLRYRLAELNIDTLPALNIARSGHATLCANGELTVFGGHTDGFIPTPTAEYFRDGEWHVVPLAYPHDHGTAIELRSGKVFLAGGHKEPLGIGQLFSAELYDPDSHTSRGFGCMTNKRAYATAAEMVDGQVVIAGNWYGDDCIEIFSDVDNPANTNASMAKETSIPRATPYILRISDDDAIIFGSLDNKAKLADFSVVDRLKGPSYREPFLDTWNPLYTIDIQRDINHFIGNEALGQYEWLLPVENDETGRIAIARVTGNADTDSVPTFSLLQSSLIVPDSILGTQIIYSSLVCDRERQFAYLIGDNSEARVFVVAIPYNEPDARPITIYVTDSQHILARNTTPALTPEGDLVFAGGHLKTNFSPANTVFRLRLGAADETAAIAAVNKAEMAPGARWLWVVIPCLIACIVIALLIVRRKRAKISHLSAEKPIVDEVTEEVPVNKNMPKDDTLANLFKRIDRLMQVERLYLNANLKTSDVAARVGSNTAYVSAAINSQRGCSFTQFLTDYRISYAKELMRQAPESKISIISAQSGFSTDSTFFRAFRASTGMSPKEWIATLPDDRP